MVLSSCSPLSESDFNTNADCSPLALSLLKPIRPNLKSAVNQKESKDLVAPKLDAKKSAPCAFANLLISFKNNEPIPCCCI